MDLIRSRKLIKAFGAVCVAAFTAAIMGYAVLGSTTRYMADDYWTAYLVKATPFWQLPAFWYTHWSGRYSFFFLVSLVEKAGTGIVPILPSLALFALVCAFTGLAIHWLKRLQLGLPPAGIAILAALLFVYNTIHSTPNVLQSLYWQTGMLTYYAPIVFFVAYLAGVSRLAGADLCGWRLLWLAISGLVVFFIGGFSETAIAIQVTAFGLAIIICGLAFFLHLPGSKPWLPWLGVGLAASLVAMVVIILAPGNQIRLAGSAPLLNLIYVFTTAFSDGLGSLKTAIRTYPLDSFSAFIIPTAAAYFLAPSQASGHPSKPARAALMAIISIPMAVIILVVAGNAPAYYAMHSGPPIRTEVMQQAILTAGLIAVGVAAGVAIRYGTPLVRLNQGWLANAAMAAILILLVLGPGRFLVKAAAQYPVLHGYATQWEARDRQLRQAALDGQQVVTVKQIGQLDQTLGDLRAEPDFWINQKAAEYYGLKSISAK